MKTTLILITAIFFALCSCKEEFVPKPTSAIDVHFSWGGPLNTDSSLVMGTDDLIVLTSKSLNANSIEWDLGNGKKSYEQILNLTYSNKGEYRVTLTAIGKDGSQSISSKIIYVRERVITGLSIDYFNFNSFSNYQKGLPGFSKLDLWVELKFASDNWPPYTNNNDVNVNSFY